MNKGCLIAMGILLVVATLGLGFYFTKDNGKDDQQTEFTKAEITNIVKKTVATGAIKPRKEIQVKPQVSGVVDELYIEPGEIVNKGQKLAKIKLVPSQLNINNAQSNVELSRIRYNEARRELERQRELSGKKLDIESSRISYEDARKEEERQRALFDDGIISEQEYLQFKVNKELRKAEYDNIVISAESTLKQLEAEVDIRQQELDAAVNNLQLLREGATRNSKQVSNIVTSTVDGMVLEVPVEEGTSVIERNNFNEGTSIASIADMNSLIFEGKVDESDVGKLKEGMPLELSVGAIEGTKFAAILEYISPKGVVEEGTVKFTVKAAVKPAADIFLRAGYSANGDIILDRRDSVLSLKERDVIFKGDSTFVEVKTGDNKFEKRQIKTGLSDGIQIEVLEGIDTSTIIKVLKGNAEG